LDEWYDPDPAAADKMSTRWGGFLDGVDEFDAAFFGISPREAVTLDPQHRILLEAAWEAFENAGQNVEELAGSLTGVFVGMSNTDYLQLQIGASISDAHLETGNRASFAAGRISYALDLRGPSLVLDTVCSSSLVAVHLACQSLRTGDSRLALAGGVNLVLCPLGTVMASKLGMMARDGRCKPLDSRADGFVRSEGCGLVVLKRLSEAILDGDRILAVIRGSAVNQDGRSAGITAPNGVAQRAAMRLALERAGIDPALINYVEMHGTGTSLGDPIEFEGLSEIYGRPESDAQQCILGAVKSNIGHTEAAAGIAGLIKVVLALQHEEIPPNLHFEILNPMISTANTRFVIPSQSHPWPAGARPRYAAVSSFGLSGTNAHVVLQEAPSPSDASGRLSGGSVQLLPISARSSWALRALAERWRELLLSPKREDLGALCYTAAVRRTHHTHRLAAVGQSHAELSRALENFLRGDGEPGLSGARPLAEGRCQPVFVFSGQGGQWVGMARALMRESPVFTEAIERCRSAFRPYMDRDLIAQLDSDWARAGIDLVQPMLFAIALGLTSVWKSWGVEPGVVVGHSMGEVAAAHVAGALTLEDAARIICCRSKMLRRVSGLGTMAIVDVGVQESLALISKHAASVSVAASNSRRSTVLSGDVIAIEQLLLELQERGVYCRRLQVDVASHSPQMDTLRVELMEVLAAVKGHPLAIPMYSTVLDRMVSGEELTAGYWVRNLREPVHFSSATEALAADKFRYWIEVSPHPVLSTSIREELADGVVVASMHRDQNEWETLLESLGQLYVAGYDVRWRKFFGTTGRCVTVPNNPWQHERFWATDGHWNRRTRAKTGVLNLPGPQVSPAGDDTTHYWEGEWSVTDNPWLEHHRIQGEAVLPASAYVELALLAAADTRNKNAWCLGELNWKRLLTFVKPRRIQIALHGEHFSVCSRAADEEDWTEHCRGTLAPLSSERRSLMQELEEARSRCTERVSADSFYSRMTARSLEYGPNHRCIREIWRRPGEAIAYVERRDTFTGFLDSCLQVMTASAEDDVQVTSVPVRVERIEVFEDPTQPVWVWARQTPGAIDVLNLDGRVVLSVRNLELAQLTPRGGDDVERCFYQWEWQPQARQEAKPAGGRWVILGNAEGLASQLRREMEARGAECLEQVTGAPCRGVVVLWGLERQPAWERVLELVRELAARDPAQMPRLWLVTRGLEGSLLLGLGRTVMYEHPELHCTLIEYSGEDASELASELAAASSEAQILLGPTGRCVGRLVRANGLSSHEPSMTRANGDDFRMEISTPGVLDGTILRAFERRAPGPGEVGVQVVAAGLNFLDVLTLLGRRPGEPSTRGMVVGEEFAGRVVAVGPGVSGFSVDDAVIGCADGSLATYVVAPADAVVLKPEGLSFQQAAAIPVALATAYCSLYEMARLQPGERVLIHSAAGATGLALVQVARWLGAEVWATAGTEEKRAYLRQLGIQEVMDSRTTDFVQHIQARTENQGVDVVVNSLAGHAGAAGLSVLAVNGRFIELGKKDIYDGRRLDLSYFRKGLSYFAVDLKCLKRTHPARFSTLLQQVTALVSNRVLEGVPIEAHDIGGAEQVFHKLASGRQIGKLVLTFGTPDTTPIARFTGVRQSGTYLITGGLGGLGLLVARWLVQRGARFLALAGRSKPTPQANTALEELRQSGVTVRVFQADVSRADSVTRMFNELDHGMPPLRGVIHAAAVLDDGMLVEMGRERFETVLAPKVKGAQHLDRLTRNRRLDWFVLFSSVASVLGSPGQGNYAAANAYLDRLASERRSAGLPAVSINWGAWAEVGLAAAQANRGLRLQDRGMASMAPTLALAAFERILTRECGQVAVMRFDVERWRENYPTSADSPVFEHLLDETSPRLRAPHAGIRDVLRSADPQQHRSILEAHVGEQIGRVLRVPVERIDRQTPLVYLGLDSLLALELRNRLQASLGLKLPGTVVWTHPTLNALSNFLLESWTAK